MYLNTHSYFSLRYGVMSPKDLLALAQSKGITSFALTDINNTSGCLNFIRIAPKYGIKPIVGIDFRNGVKQQFIALAKNREGFREINSFLSNHIHNKKEIPNLVPHLPNTYIIYPWLTCTKKNLKENEFLGVRPEELLKIPFSKWKNHIHKMVILQSVTFRHQLDFNIHRLFRAIDNNSLLSKLPKNEEAIVTDQMLPEKELYNCYQNYPEIINNTESIMASCSAPFIYDNEHRNIKTYYRTEEDDYKQIRRLCLEGIPYRYTKPTFNVYRRIIRELEVIKSKNFVSYFLINWDIVHYALSKGYFYVGRGSGANSVVAYLLRITDVDPIELDLYFERFINLYRQNPPDFDIDFSWTDRDDIIRYIFEKFGMERTCLLATYNTFQRKAAIKELGKVFGLPTHEIEKISGSEQADSEPLTQLILKYSKCMEGIPSHLSIHAGGIIISQDPIHYFTATNLPPKGFPTTQFDMVVAEDIGLYKFDILSQRGLGKIKDTLAIIQANSPEPHQIDIHDTRKFFKDKKVKYLLRNGQTIGCFYVESPAMRMLLKKLQADHYLGLVAASSVIRPGVAKSGMMREYILRFRIPEKRNDAHPVLKNLMPETFGVMVYQEDVIKVAHYFAKLDLGEADMLRRGMSGKFRSRDEFQKIKQKYFDNCKKEGYDDQLTQDVWIQIESFAGYAFAKGHSASYAIESYQSLYLKAHYPLEYMVAVINNGGGFYQREFYIHEARMHGAIIEPPCINISEKKTIIKGQTIYLGFHIVNELEIHTIDKLIKERYLNGSFISLQDLVNKTDISLKQIILLIRLNALRIINKNKKNLLWEAHLLLSGYNNKSVTLSLFEKQSKNYPLPTLNHDPRENSFDEIELINFPLTQPFNLIKHLPENKTTPIKDITNHKNKFITVLGYLVTVKKTSAAGNKTMFFGTFLDQEGHFIDTVHFPTIAYRYPFRGKGIYEITGKVVEEFDFYSIEVSVMKRLHYFNMDHLEQTPKNQKNFIPS